MYIYICTRLCTCPGLCTRPEKHGANPKLLPLAYLEALFKHKVKVKAKKKKMKKREREKDQQCLPEH